MRHPYGGGFPCCRSEETGRRADGGAFHRLALQVPAQLLEALGHTAPENDFEAMQALEEATGRTAPASLAVLRQKAERFSTVIDPAQIAEVALGCQA